MSGGKRGLGHQAPPVLAAPRRAPGVLAKLGAPSAVDASTVRELSVDMGKLKTQHEEMRSALGDALDGWEAIAGAADLERIEEMRKRWGLQSNTAVTDQDLTDDTGKM